MENLINDNNDDATKELLTDIIKWEKDIFEYFSLESILKEKYNISLKNKNNLNDAI